MQKWFRLMALVLVSVIVLAACSSKTPSKAPEGVIKMKLASAVTPPNMVHMPAYIALEEGFFKGEGLEVEIVSLEGGVGTARAIMSGAADIAGTSADPVLAAAAARKGESDEDLIGIYTYAPRLMVSMVATSDVKSAADLKGKKIGIQEPGAFADALSRLVLAQSKIDPSQVSFVSTSTAGRLPALLNGQTNTAILHVDQSMAAVKKNPQLNIIANLQETEPKWLYSLFATTRGKIKENPEMMNRFVRAMIKAGRWMYQPENKAKLVDDFLKYNKNFDRDIAEAAYDQMIKAQAWPVNEGVSDEILTYTYDTQVKFGILKTDKKIKPSEIYDRSFAEKVLKDLGRSGKGL